MNIEYEFVIDKTTGRLKTDQFCFGSKYTLIHDEEAFHVWKRHSDHVFIGTGRPWKYVPTIYMITKVIKIEANCMTCVKLKELIPGHNWKRKVVAFVEECKSMVET